MGRVRRKTMTSEYQKGVLELIENLKNRGAINNMERGRLRRAILVESERPHGKWKTFRGMKEDMYCSKCDMDFPNDEKNRSLFNFCPFCGADMREGDGS